MEEKKSETPRIPNYPLLFLLFWTILMGLFYLFFESPEKWLFFYLSGSIILIEFLLAFQKPDILGSNGVFSILILFTIAFSLIFYSMKYENVGSVFKNFDIIYQVDKTLFQIRNKEKEANDIVASLTTKLNENEEYQKVLKLSIDATNDDRNAIDELLRLKEKIETPRLKDTIEKVITNIRGNDPMLVSYNNPWNEVLGTSIPLASQTIESLAEIYFSPGKFKNHKIQIIQYILDGPFKKEDKENFLLSIMKKDSSNEAIFFAKSYYEADLNQFGSRVRTIDVDKLRLGN